MKALQVRRDPAGAEVIVLAEIQNLANHVARRRARRAPRRARAIAQAGIAVLDVALLPFVKDLREIPNRRHTRATFPSSAASRNTRSRQAVSRTCSALVITAPLEAQPPKEES